MRAFQIIGLFLLAAVLAVGITFVSTDVAKKMNTSDLQEQLQPFYETPQPLPVGKPGEIIRSQPMTDLPWKLNDAVALRTLSYSNAPDGTQRITGGMVIYPTKPSTKPRNVVAYAHGTSGFGDSCAPSRSPATPAAMPWVQTMLDNGWVVTTTDYVGLGTAGAPYYLIAQSEATDVVNSVRAARNIAAANAGTSYAVFGQSQGGHSAVWTGALSKKIAPELNLVAVAATAPAAEVGALMDQEWNTAVAWGIGPEVMVSWPLVYPNLKVDSIITPAGKKPYQALAYECIQDTLITGEINVAKGSLPFSQNPSSDPAWATAVDEQTAKPLPASIPTFISESTTDGIVLPNTISLLQKKWCAAGSTLWVNWLGPLATGATGPLLTHPNEPLVAWPAITNWLEQRFQGLPAANNCTTRPPIRPYIATGS